MYVNWYGQTITMNIQNQFQLLAVEGLGRLRRQYNPVTPGLYPGAIFGSPVLPPRTIRLVWLLEASDYNDYWNKRASLLSIFNTQPVAFLTSQQYGIIQFITPTGTEIRMEAVLTNAIDFPEPRQGWTHRVVTEFTLLHPFFRTGVFVNGSVSLSSGSASFQLTNAGNVEGGIRFTLVGPLSSVTITNTNQNSGWGRNTIQTATALSLVANQSIVISNLYDNPFRFDMAGKFQEPERLTEFRIWPAPYVAGGVNTITVSATGVGSQSRIDYSFVSMTDGI